MSMHYGPGGSWQYYNFYGYPDYLQPGASGGPTSDEDHVDLSGYDHCFPSSHRSVSAGSPHPSNETSSSATVLCSAMTLKVLSQSNKRDFTVFTLRDVTEGHMKTPTTVKSMISTQIGNAVSDTLDFPLGYYRKSEKVWINNEQDVKDALKLMKEVGKVTLWCIGQDRAKKRDRSTDDLPSDLSGPTKKKTVSEERASRVNDLKVQLRKRHSSTYSGVQYAMWAEMLVGGGHDSMDEPPAAPMFGAARARGKPSPSNANLTEAFKAMAGSIADALSPRPVSSSGSDSPSKAVNLRGKYIQQLKDLVNLKEIGALTEDEYQEHRSVIVNLMRKLN